jgi:TonB family protein
MVNRSLKEIDMHIQTNRGSGLAIAFCVALCLAIPAATQSGKPPVVPPQLLKMAKPDCSSGHSCHGIHGLVELTVDVLTDGTIGDVKVKSGDPRLADEALIAAKQCRFKAGTLMGKPTSMNFDLKYQF